MTTAEPIRPSARRLFILEFDLVPLSAHFFNQVLGFRKAAESLGIEPCIFVPNSIEPALAQSLGARNIIDAPAYHLDEVNALDGVLAAWLRLDDLWNSLDAVGVTQSDIVLITSSRPAVILGVADWLGRLPGAARPAIFFQFSDRYCLVTGTMDYSLEASISRFVTRLLSSRPGQERVFLTVNNETLTPVLERLRERRVFFMPVPKYFGTQLSGSDDARHGTPIVYVHVNHRSMVDDVHAILEHVLRARADVRFRVKYSKHAGYAPAPKFAGANVELMPAEQSTEDYLEMIAGCDLVLLPYQIANYRTLTSGVFCEATAMGKVSVVPAPSWMEDQITRGYAAGVAYDALTPRKVADAVEVALTDLPRLQADARARAQAFRAEHTCRRILDIMIELASKAHDMRPVHK